jgi:histidinol-phosphate aminotransferase
MFNLDRLTRENIKKLNPYSSARDEFKGEARIFLDANENSLGSPLIQEYNRYPDPQQWKLKEALAQIKGVTPQSIFLGNGSDECIDLLYRAFCNPGKDNIILNTPTYGMYEVCARINDVEIKKVNLQKDFQLDMEGLEKALDLNTKIIWICSPNNPTGNSMIHGDIEILLNQFDGLVVIDEAYINFSAQLSFLPELEHYPNLVILHTLSKAWGLAGLRLGMAFASESIIGILNRIKPPYNINQATQELALTATAEIVRVNEMIRSLVGMRAELAKSLMSINLVKQVYPSDANFLLVKVADAAAVYAYLIELGIVVRDRSRIELCEGCLRITVGTEMENKELVTALHGFSKGE